MAGSVVVRKVSFPTGTSDLQHLERKHFDSACRHNAAHSCTHWRPRRPEGSVGRRQTYLRAVAGEKDAAGNEMTLQEYFDSLAKTQKPASVLSEEIAARVFQQEKQERPRASVAEQAATSSDSKQAAAPGLLEEGFLRLTRAADWVVGAGEPPTAAPVQQDENLSQSPGERKQEAQAAYGALKRELFLMTGAIATAVDLYIFFAFDLENTVSYALGVAGSFAYLALLMRYADRVERQDVPEVFRKRKSRRRQSGGITGGGVSAFAARLAVGGKQPWSSARLLPFAGLFITYSLWNRLAAEPTNFHLQLAPLILGSFVYKAACLIVAYRDNERLRTNMTWEQRDDGEDSDDELDFSDLPPF